MNCYTALTLDNDGDALQAVHIQCDTEAEAQSIGEQLLTPGAPVKVEQRDADSFITRYLRDAAHNIRVYIDTEKHKFSASVSVFGVASFPLVQVVEI